MQLRKTQPVCVFNNQGVDVRHIHAGFDDGGADEHVNFPIEQIAPNLTELFFLHLAVGNANACIRQEFADACRRAGDRVHPVMQVVDLPAAPQLLLDRFRQNPHIVLHHIGLHRMAVLRGLLQHRHIADAGHRHVERAGDGGSGEGEHIDGWEQLLEMLLLRHAEALLLIDDDKAQIFELDIL